AHRPRTHAAVVRTLVWYGLAGRILSPATTGRTLGAVSADPSTDYSVANLGAEPRRRLFGDVDAFGSRSCNRTFRTPRSLPCLPGPESNVAFCRTSNCWGLVRRQGRAFELVPAMVAVGTVARGGMGPLCHLCPQVWELRRRLALSSAPPFCRFPNCLGIL